MISKLKGILDSVGDDWLVLDVSGVGYSVSCSSKTLSRLPEIGAPLVLLTHMVVSENATRLIGFFEASERENFRLLLTVQGVGVRVALAILSVLSGSELARALVEQDKAMISRAPGVGGKLAQRIVTELKDHSFFKQTFKETESLPSHPGIQGSSMHDAASALLNLGYVQPHIGRALQLVVSRQGGGEATAEGLIRQALKELSSPLLKEEL